MNIYPQLNNLELNELIKYWFGSPPADEIECYTPQGDYVGLFYEETAGLIAEYGQPGIDFLLKQVTQSDFSRLRAILTTLGNTSPDHNLNPGLGDLFRFYLQDERPLIVAAAIDGLQQQGCQDALNEVLALRNHSSPYVRGSVLRYMSRLYPERSRFLLIEALKDPDFIVRENAVDELDELEATEAIHHIRRLLTDPNMDVQQAAQTAIENLEALQKEGKDTISEETQLFSNFTK
jgi:hypothetical protein